MVAEFFCLAVRVLCLYINFSVMCIVKKDFLPFYKLSFHSFSCSPCSAEAFSFNKVPFFTCWNNFLSDLSLIQEMIFMPES